MTPKSDPDRQREAELLSRVGEGDEQAFADLYDLFSIGLYSVALRIVYDEKEAEDVLQDAFQQIWRRANTYDVTRSSAFTWSVMIVRNKAIDRLRMRQRSHRIVEKAVDFRYFTEIDEESAGIPVVREQRAEVREALQQIPKDQQQAIGLSFFSGLTHEEIAAQLGEPLGTIKARIRRGLIKLRDLLKESV